MVAALPNPRIPDLACHPCSGGLAWNPSCWLSFRLAAHVPKSLQHTSHDLLREIITAIAKSEALTPQIDQNREGYTVWIDDSFASLSIFSIHSKILRAAGSSTTRLYKFDLEP